MQSFSSINWNNYKITANDEVYQNISSALSDTGTLVTTLIIVITAVSIVNLYLTSCVQYFALAGAMVFCGKAARRVLAIQSEVPVQVTPYMLNPPVEATGPDYAEEVEPEEDDTDFEAWGFREKEE